MAADVREGDEGLRQHLAAALRDHWWSATDAETCSCGWVAPMWAEGGTGNDDEAEHHAADVAHTAFLEHQAAEVARALAAATVGARPEQEAIERGVELLLRCADGRKEYAANAPDDQALILNCEASVLERAARIVQGDFQPCYGLLPSWRWDEAGLPEISGGDSPRAALAPDTGHDNEEGE